MRLQATCPRRLHIVSGLYLQQRRISRTSTIDQARIETIRPQRSPVRDQVDPTVDSRTDRGPRIDLITSRALECRDKCAVVVFEVTAVCSVCLQDLDNVVLCPSAVCAAVIIEGEEQFEVGCEGIACLEGIALGKDQ